VLGGDRQLQRREPDGVEHAQPLSVHAVPAPPINESGAVAIDAHGAAAAAAKRAFDIVVSALLIVLLAPIWLGIALIIKLDAAGPILFRQPRVGRNGNVFLMLKFRTMIRDADRHKMEVLHLNEAADGLFKISTDPRLTRFGRLLRSTSLDELPQLIHVLLGQMSLVGPRPLIPEEDVQIEGPYRQRLEVRPGMTGAWQVAGASRIPIWEMVEMDRNYVNEWSLWGDVKLLAGTASHVLLRRGV